MAWFRLHEGAYADAKWPIIARKSNTNVGTVVSIWIALLDYASQHETRGSLEGFDPETIDALYGYDEGTCQSVFNAMVCKGMIADDRIANWEKRQPLKEDSTSKERKERYNERHGTPKNDLERSGTQPEHHGTPKNAPDKIRIDKSIKGNFKTPPLIPPRGESEALKEPPPEQSSGKTGTDPEKPKSEKRKRESTGNTKPEIQAQFMAYTENPELRRALEDFRQMRERLRKPLTGRAVELTLSQLDELSGGDEALKILILNQSVVRSWQGIFPLAENNRYSRASPATDGLSLAQRNYQTGLAVLAQMEKEEIERAV